MNGKVIIKNTNQSNLLKAIINYMESEKIEYSVQEELLNVNYNVEKVIYIDDNKDFDNFLKNLKTSVIFISDKKRIIDSNLNINYIITNLVHDKTKYTDVQNEYLYKKGIYHIFLEKLGELLENINNYDRMIYDLTELKSMPNNWVFSFESINDTYSWLSNKNKMLPNNFVRKVINFYDEKVYDDSLREINYLTEKLMEIKEGKNIIDIFICNKDELKIFEKNYFFKLLVKNICSTYQFYLIDKDKLLANDKDMAIKLMDGIAIYNDCVYRDTYDDELSLGYVDCNESTIKEYNKYFDYILNKYGVKIKTESDLNEF